MGKKVRCVCVQDEFRIILEQVRLCVENLESFTGSGVCVVGRLFANKRGSFLFRKRRVCCGKIV